ncbi:indole-3-glycerol phosphate synthase [Streptohalobacillus salinus]|uniref:Indole-3-glycerol phosphate synthase n=1 Tax=Streptohalobacillus salinus TaxID=621096 RepID=A0A2V3WC29_9BACI|nr:indole-3-glycerol phosphate synthase TrpC [Streptohalobacillus salinus]PXW92125.1 indole-3-glycerol phosphate synthase [Streptohalobacillus salinus]
MTILDDIIKAKQIEVDVIKAQRAADNRKRTVPLVSFLDAVNTQPMHVIAEFKRHSPSKGMINKDVEPAEQARIYQASGASMISVLTDYPYFKGTMADLVAVKEAVSLPVLNKDFIIDPVQIDRAYQHGADVILLIVGALTKEQFTNLYHYATAKGLEVLVEVHDETEVKTALAVDAPLIGINNRNLKTFETSLKQTEALAPLINTEKHVLVSESGIKTKADVVQVKAAGARAVLVGETLMKTSPEAMIKAFTEDLS